MEGQREADSGALLAYSWAPGWNSNQSIYRYQESVGGALKGGDPGVRLSAAVAARQRRTRTPPKAAAPQPGYRLIPLHAPFGAEELSARAPAVAERSAPPFLVLNPADAQTLELAQGRGVRCAGIDATLELRLDPAMEPGHAGVSVGIGGIGVLPGAPAQISADPQLVARS
jgi:NADH-quinone oxidoreductase subunit G